MTRLGVFPYHRSDDDKMSKRINDGLQKQPYPDKNYKSYIQLCLNSIQNKLVEFLQPIGHKHPQDMVCEMLEIWKRSKDLTDRHLDLNSSLEKMI